MRNNKEKGFALILSIVLMLAMSLMGGGLIIIASGDHSSNNSSEDYQQTFYVAETALLEGERYLLNKFLGPWDSGKHERDKTKRALPDDTIKFKGKMEKINYNKAFKDFYETDNICFQSFSDINATEINVVIADSYNFGKMLADGFKNKKKEYFEEAETLQKYYFDYFITKIGAAPFRGSGGSVKKGANNLGNDGMAYRVHGCGIRGVGNADPIVVGLESVVVLPK